MTVPNTLPLSGIQTDPIRNFKFIVSFKPKAGSTDASWSTLTGNMGFVSVSGLSITTESIAYREGGFNTSVHQIPGQTSFTPITLSKGAMLGGSGNMDWMKKLFSVLTPNTNSGAGVDFRCDLEIQVLSHPNPVVNNGSGYEAADEIQAHTSMRFYVYNAWITNLTYSNLDAGANAFMVEDMQLVHEGFDVRYGKDLTATGSAAPFGAGGTNQNR
jgi:phage tail-like protein